MSQTVWWPHGRYWIAFSLLLCEGSAAAASVAWVCPQARVSAVPTSVTIEITLDSESGAVQSLGLDELFSKAVAEPRLDFTDCFRDFSINVAIARGRECTPSEHPAYCGTPRSSETYRALEDRVAIYSAHAARAGAVSPFEPGAYNQPSPTPDRLQAMTNVVGYLCGIDHPDDLRFLDAAFLEGVLPSLVTGPGAARLRAACQATQPVHRAWSQMIKTAAGLEFSAKTCTAEPDACLLQHQRIARVMARVMNLAKQLGFPVVADATLRRLESSGRELAALNRALFDTSLESSQSLSCVDLKPGEAKSFYADPGTGLSGLYQLTRLPDEALSTSYRRLDGSTVPTGTRVASYESVVNLLFMDHTGKVGTPEKMRKWSDWVQSCYELARPFLRGPDGEFLRIRYVSDEGPTAPVQPHRIGIYENARGNAGNWMLGFHCGTVLHETLHFHGLVDEYHEAWTYLSEGPHGELVTSESAAPGRYIQDDCRILGPKDSIMVDHSAAWFAVSLRTSYWDSQGIPISRTPARSSLLSPAEFRALVRPGCLAENRVFYSCSRESTKTSHENFGRDRCSVGLPDECSLPAGQWIF